MKPHSFAVSAFLALAMMASAAPRLVVSTPTLVPESKIDLVLDLPVTETTDLGKTTPNTWLEIKPALPGKLRWKAQNIAEFLPDQSPAIGATYTFSIPKNLKHLDTTPVPPGKFATLTAEPFRIASTSLTNRWSNAYSPSACEWLLAFNDEIDPSTASGFVLFYSKSGQRVAARLERCNFERAGYLANNKPWAARWGNTPATEIKPDPLTKNILIATPISPLPPGEAWQIGILKGLPNQTTSARLTADSNYEIGNIAPFNISEIKCAIYPDEPRRITVNFNHPLPDVLPADFLEKSLSITPRPENLTIEVANRQIKITGDLLAADQYQVSVNPPLFSKSGLPLAASMSAKVTFEHLKPQIAFPSEDVGQLAKGTRQYRMFTMNLESAHVRIKKLTGLDLVRAFQGYRHFTGNGPDEEGIRPTAPIPYSLIVGTPVLDREIPLGNAIDTTKIITLSWDEILPK
ncbi:MAG: hypothetical protein H8M99_12985, partial [Gloeobacteraceae cyanobacterium ES-bin-144]|nr:hypothetical protein [Verrucomicrobiales bacterium]